MQHLLCVGGGAVWDTDAVRDDMREYVAEHLHDEAAVLVVDETGGVKKGTHTVAVQRQYTGTAGGTENSQVAVFLDYAGARGHATVDRELYIRAPGRATRTAARRAGLGEDIVFATKPGLARTMIDGSWTPDTASAGSPETRSTEATRNSDTALAGRGIGYVLSVACSAEVSTGAGKFPADALAAKLPKRAWQKLSAGRGAKGRRFYDCAVIDLAEAAPGHHQSLIRRNRTTQELVYYRCFSPWPVPLAEPVRAAGSRWRVEEAF